MTSKTWNSSAAKVLNQSSPAKRFAARFMQSTPQQSANQKLFALLEEAEEKITALTEELASEKQERKNLEKKVERGEPMLLDSSNKENVRHQQFNTQKKQQPSCNHRAELAILRSELTRTKDQLEHASHAMGELEELRKHKMKTVASIENLKSTVTRLQHEKRVAENQVQVLQQQVSNTAVMNQTLLNEVIELTEIVEGIQRQHDVVTPDIEVDSIEDEMRKAIISNASQDHSESLATTVCTQCGNHNKGSKQSVTQTPKVVQALLSARHLRQTLEESVRKEEAFSSTAAMTTHRKHWALSGEVGEHETVGCLTNSSECTIWSEAQDVKAASDNTVVLDPVINSRRHQRQRQASPQSIVTLQKTVDLSDLGLKAFLDVVFDLKQWLKQVSENKRCR